MVFLLVQGITSTVVKYEDQGFSAGTCLEKLKLTTRVAAC